MDLDAIECLNSTLSNIRWYVKYLIAWFVLYNPYQFEALEYLILSLDIMCQLQRFNSNLSIRNFVKI